MKVLCLESFVLLSLVFSPAMAQEQESPWFDMMNCSYCKHLGEHMDMMSQMTWEIHAIENGLLMASSVAKDYKAEWQDLKADLDAVEKKLEAGEKLPLCGSCHALQELFETGAKKQEIDTEFGLITLVTSDEPEIVKKLHEHAKKTQEELKKMVAPGG